MASLFEAWGELVKHLNTNLKEKNKEYKFIKTSAIHNIPQYPYCTIGLLVDGGDTLHTLEGIKTTRAEEERIIINRTTTNKITFSLTFFSDKQEESVKFAEDTRTFLESGFKPISEKYDIILLECTKLIDKTTFLENNFIHKFGFDVILNTILEVEQEIDSIKKVEIENINEKKEE